jgi:TolB protein
VKLERDADIFTVSASKNGGPFQPVGALSLALPDPVYVGLGVTAHNSKNSETALISNVVLKNRVALATEKRVRETTLETLVAATGERRQIYRDLTLFEAPNWSRDGKLFYINRAGGIFTLPVTGGDLSRLDTGIAQKCNNDHGLSFDGRWLAISSNEGKDGSKIYVVPATGGPARLVTPVGPSYWHGWSPDGTTLAYCAKRVMDNFDIYTIPTAGGAETRLTTADGPRRWLRIFRRRHQDLFQLRAHRRHADLAHESRRHRAGAGHHGSKFRRLVSPPVPRRQSGSSSSRSTSLSKATPPTKTSRSA